MIVKLTASNIRPHSETWDGCRDVYTSRGYVDVDTDKPYPEAPVKRVAEALGFGYDRIYDRRCDVDRTSENKVKYARWMDDGGQVHLLLWDVGMAYLMNDAGDSIARI